jgi:hypothetical protein
MYKIILAAAIVAATGYAAIAREVCHDEQVKQITCTTVNGSQSCTVTYVTAQRCHQEPDNPKSAAAGRATQTMQSDNETNWVPEKGSDLANKPILLLQ